jgi:hypothetical protein
LTVIYSAADRSLICPEAAATDDLSWTSRAAAEWDQLPS